MIVEASSSNAYFVKPDITTRRVFITVDNVPNPAIYIRRRCAGVRIVDIVSYTFIRWSLWVINPPRIWISDETMRAYQTECPSLMTYKSAEPLSKSIVNFCGGVPISIGSR